MMMMTSIVQMMTDRRIHIACVDSSLSMEAAIQITVNIRKQRVTTRRATVFDTLTQACNYLPKALSASCLYI